MAEAIAHLKGGIRLKFGFDQFAQEEGLLEFDNENGTIWILPAVNVLCLKIVEKKEFDT